MNKFDSYITDYLYENREVALEKIGYIKIISFAGPDSRQAPVDYIFDKKITTSTGLVEYISEKTGKEDMRGAYGLHGQEMITWLTHLQHTREKNVWFVGILEEKVDEYNRKTFSLQIDGSKTANELPGIVDQVITLAKSNYR